MNLRCLLASAIGLSVAIYSGAAMAQDNVRDLTGHEPTADELIDGLKPHRQTRGIGVTTSGANPNSKPQCSAIKGAQTRGIGAAPVSDSVAMKVEFDSGSARLSPAATQTLDQLGKALTSNDLKAYCFVIEGHTDSVGSDALNKRLSEMRADSVVRYLSDHFKIDKDRLQAVGYGKDKPIAENATDEGRRKNRRVQIANLGG